MAQSIDDARRRHRGQAGTRVPPNNIEAEESLLGAMLLSREAIAAAIEGQLNPADFYKPAHGHIYDAITTLYAEGAPADPVTVAELLRRADLLDQIGGGATLVSLQAGTPAIGNAPRYARIVHEHSLLRRLIGVAGDIAEMGYDLPHDVNQVIDQAETLVFAVAERRLTESVTDLDTALHEALDRIEARIEAGAGDIIGVPLGYRDVDDALLGLQPQGLYVVAAAPGHCKTSFVLGAATHVAMTMRRPVVFFSLEMSRAALTQRILAAQARVDSRRLRTGKLADTDWPKVTSAIGRLQGSPLVIDETSICTLLHMRARCRRVRARHGDLGLVVVDYLQLMTSTGRAENRQVEVAQFSRGLKLLAKDLDVPVLVAAQINRNVDQRQDKRPGLSDLRESGAIEADSDAVLCLYRDELYNPDSKEKGLVEVLIRKHREGETRSDIRLAFLGQYSTLASMAHV
ncbi:MAG: replicative DNA helicase [Acidimicrobiales bacterium]